jgi:Na+-driven multidrug efflux pump
MGVRGAAWATAFSQILGAAALLITLQLVSKVTARTQR